ncbi:multiple inositol polyphosphate phosphatase 1 [Aplysia californica]|uniref:Multiple inositol polyphosphate phosphatase 1 n=1 Tax=Aplysia californica TaxID=6500 RepID=A0ABM0JTT5_APLCA|nr:multiple inositol polyphosphate phosphatase 1 [Aplysia californica]
MKMAASCLAVAVNKPHISMTPSQLLFIIVLLVGTTNLSTASSPLKHFSTKTPYAWITSSKTTELVDDEMYHLTDVEGLSCSAVHANAVIRHGSRFPGLDDVLEISNVHEKLVVAMEPDVNPELYNWVNNFPSNNNKALSSLGEEEQEALGSRLAKKLHTLFSDEDFSNFKFMVSSAERTKQSASAFFEGLSTVVQGEEDDADDFDVEVNDELLRFFDLCKKYVYSVGNNKTAMKEYTTFMNSHQVVKIKDKMSEKLGISKDILTTANVRLIYLICGYETASFKSSPWCSLLDEEDMVILEYLGDLKHYYKNGYGHDITWQQSCPLLNEMFYVMDETIVEIETTEDDEEMDGFIVGHFAFGHAETVGPLLSALGLFNDSEPLLAGNFEQQEKRLFRTSEILPFSSNVLFVLYECVPEEFGEDEEIDEADYYLRLFVNEVPVKIPGCEELSCPYKTVRGLYHSFVEECDFKKICNSSHPKDEL